MKNSLKALIGLCLAAAAADAVTTYCAIYISGSTACEVNPFTRWAVGEFGPFWGQAFQKATSLYAVCWCGWAAAKFRLWGFELALALLTVMQMAAALNNVYQIQEYSREMRPAATPTSLTRIF